MLRWKSCWRWAKTAPRVAGWLFCVPEVSRKKGTFEKQRSLLPGIWNIQKMCLFQLDLTPNHVDMKNRLAVAEKFWERRLGKVYSFCMKGMPIFWPILTLRWFPWFLVPYICIEHWWKFPENFVAISHSHSKDHGTSHGCREYERSTVNGTVALVGLCLVRRSGCEGRLRRNNLVQRGLSRSAKPQGGIGRGMYQDCTSQRGTVVDGKVPINTSPIYSVGIYGSEKIPKNPQRRPAK